MTKAKMLVSAIVGTFLSVSISQAQPFGGADDTAYAAALWQALNAANLAGPGALESKAYPGQHPHGAVLQNMDSTIAVNGQTGAVIVKRNYGGEGVSVEAVAQDPSKYLAAVTVILRELHRPWIDHDRQGNLPRR